MRHPVPVYVTVLFMSIACTSTRPVVPVQSYPPISHKNLTGTTLPGISLTQLQTLRVTIVDTDSDCFTYNPVPQSTVSTRDVGAGKTSFTFDIIHDESYNGYEIQAVRKPGSDCANSPLAEKKWVIPVLSNWRVAMSGAVTFDQLTDPVYHLEAGTKEVEGEDVAGYFVRRDEDDEDVTRTSGGAMAHLYNTQWGSWVPLVFGVSLAENPTYLVGTGVRLGQQGHLTVGAAIGPRAHLPAHLDEGSFVTEANAINTLGSRNDIELFIAVSLSFFEKNLGKLTGLIKPAEE